jgi:elongation factor G
MDPGSGYSTIHADVPMAEVLSYAPDLTSMTGGRADYAMSFLRYEQVPAHVAAGLISAAKDKDLAKA